MLEKELLRILPKNMGFVPPPVLPLIDVSSWQPPVQAVPKSNAGKKSGNVKKGKFTEVKFGKYKGNVARYSNNSKSSSLFTGHQFTRYLAARYLNILDIYVTDWKVSRTVSV